jgi:hypothetical protein
MLIVTFIPYGCAMLAYRNLEWQTDGTTAFFSVLRLVQILLNRLISLLKGSMIEVIGIHSKGTQLLHKTLPH